MIIYLIILFLIIILVDLRHLLKKENMIKYMLLYFFLLAIGFTISLFEILDKAPTSPAIIIEKIVKYVVPGG